MAGTKEKTSEQLQKELDELKQKIAQLERTKVGDSPLNLQAENNEEILWANEEKFRSIFELTPLGLSMTGIDGSMSVNKAFCEMLGYTEQELKSKNWKEITHPEDISESSKMVKSLLEGETEMANYEKRYIHKNGDIVWADIITTLKKNTEGEAEYFITSINNITERKQAEFEIKRYSRIFEDSLNEIYLFNAGTLRFTQVNNAAQKNLGYTMEELKQMTPLSFKPEFSNESFTELVEPLRTGKRDKIVFETVHQRKDQSFYHVEVHLQLINFEEQPTFVAMILDISNLKKAEAELNKSEEKLKQLLKSIPMPIVYVNSEGSFTFRNDRFIQVFGYTDKDIPGINEWWQRAYPDEEYRRSAIQNWDLAVQNASETGSDIKSDIYKVTCKNGEVRDVIISGITIENDLLATLYDITELKQAEQMLKDEKGRLRTIIDLLGSPIFMKDNDHRIILANRAFYDLFGLDEEQVIGATLAESVPENEQEQFMAVDRKVLDTGIEDVREEELTIGNFTRTIITRKIRFINESGERFLVGSIHDITERKQAEIKLLKEKEYSEEVINALPALFYQISLEGKFVNWNSNFETVTGYSADEMQKMSPVDLFEGADKSIIAQRIERVFIDGVSDAYAGLISKDGTKTPYYFTGKRIFIDDIPLLVGMGMDISELKHAEYELKKHRENLEELIKERTLELEKKNKELDDAMKVFVGRELTVRSLQERIRALEGK